MKPLFRALQSAKQRAFTLVEVIVATAITALAFAVALTSLLKGMEAAKWQSAYETACTYGEQALEYSLYIPYADFSATAPGGTTLNWVSNGLLYTTATATNFIPTTKNGSPYTLTNVTYLATQTSLPLDDLGSYVLTRSVYVTDRATWEPAQTNLNYKLITVSNTWVFLGRTQSPIIFKTIRDSP